MRPLAHGNGAVGVCRLLAPSCFPVDPYWFVVAVALVVVVVFISPALPPLHSFHHL